MRWGSKSRGSSKAREIRLEDIAHAIDPASLTPAEQQKLLRQQKQSKWGNKKVEEGGILFDSIAEAKRWRVLTSMVASGEIRALAYHVVFVILDAFVDCEGRRHQQITYEADFSYQERQADGSWVEVVEDSKGARATITTDARIKFKLFMVRYPHIRLRLITADGRRIPLGAAPAKIKRAKSQ